MLTLAIDTATNISSLAIVKDEQVLAVSSNQVKAGHAGSLLESIDELIKAAGIAKRDLELIACGLGPGSFTGIRIGIATAKGLAKALKIEFRGVCTLDALAAAALPSELPIMPLIDARKGEVFCANYDNKGNRTGELINIKPEQLRLDQPTALIGNGLAAYDIMGLLGDNCRPVAAELWNPSAVQIARLALSRQQTGTSPIYVRASDAQLLLQG